MTSTEENVMAVMVEKMEHSIEDKFTNAEYSLIFNHIDMNYKDMIMDISELPYFYNTLVIINELSLRT